MAERVCLRTSSEGYRYIDVGHPSDEGHASVLEHRLAAVAWGLLDGLDDPREIHHVDEMTTVTAEWAIEAVTRADHVERHVEEALERGEPPPRWVLSALPRERREQLVDGNGELREAVLEDAEGVVEA
jgi:hypothetical protein